MATLILKHRPETETESKRIECYRKGVEDKLLAIIYCDRTFDIMSITGISFYPEIEELRVIGEYFDLFYNNLELASKT